MLISQNSGHSDRSSRAGVRAGLLRRWSLNAAILL